MAGITNVPSTVTDPQLRLLLQQILDSIRTGNLGTGKAVTDITAASVLGGSGINTGTSTPGYNPVTDTSSPLSPTNLQAVGAFTHIILSWDPYTQAQVSFAEIYKNSVDDRGTAYSVGTSNQGVFVDSVGMQETWFYWIRWVSYAGVIGPWNAVAGTSATTAEDPAAVASVLSGMISETQLAINLNSRVNLIDTPITGLVDRMGITEVSTGINSSDISGIVIDVTDVTDGLAAELIARADADTVIETSVTNLTATVGTNTSGLSAELIARANADTAIVGTITTLNAEVDTNTAGIAAELIARSDGDSAVAATVTSLNTEVDTNTAGLAAELIARSDGDTAVAATVTTLNTEVDTNTAGLAAELIARSDGDTAVAATVTSLNTEVDTNTAGLAAELIARSDADTAIAATVTSLNTEVDTNTAGLAAELIARSDGDTAIAADVTSLTTVVGTNTAGLAAELIARSDGDTAVAATVTALNTEVDTNTAGLAAELIARSDGDSAVAATVTLLNTEVDTNTAGLAAELIARSDGDSAVAATVTLLNAEVDTNTAGLATELTARANADTAIASDVTTLTATVGGNTASISTQATAISGAEGDIALLSAEYMVKLDVNGLVSGFGLYNNGTVTDFIIHTDNFAIGKPGQTSEYPFIIGTVGGSTKIVLNAATFIPDATITDAKIDTISATKLTVVSGTIADALIGAADIGNAMIGNIIQSAVYNPAAGVGWQIDKLGSINAAAITIRDSSGNIILSSGTNTASDILNSTQDWNDISGTGIPANNANYTTNTNQLTDGASLGSTANWGNVTGTGKPDNYANNTTNTNELTDGAGLGDTANWTGLQGTIPAGVDNSGQIWSDISGSGIPDDNATQNTGVYANLAGKVTAANISTYIAGLAVDTLYIAGEAVTVADGVNNDSSTALTTSYQTIATKTVTFSGVTPVAVMVTGFGNFQTTVIPGSVFDVSMRIVAGGSSGGVVAQTHDSSTAVMASCQKYTGLSGSVVFTLQMKKNTASGTILGRNSGLLIQGVKR
tara:strand:+ start:357 stop:3431 length:3075 start_codon:yes stop_codon:yes gene_type:complete